MNPGGGINAQLPRFERGKVITADDMNQLVDSLRGLVPAGRSDGMNSIINGCGRFATPALSFPQVEFYNNDANTVPAYGIVTPAAVNTAMPSCNRPSVYGCQSNFLINGPGSVANAGYGNAQLGLGNVYIVAYDSADGSPAAGDRWGPRSGTYLLKKNTGGFIVLGISDTTNHYALVQSEPMISVRGTISGDAAPDSSVTLTVYTGAYGSEATTSQTIANVRNASDCTLKSGSTKLHRAVYDPQVPGWSFDEGRTA